jgi:hypothetical protein
LATYLGFFGVVKLWVGHAPSFHVPIWLYYAASLAELVIAMMLLANIRPVMAAFGAMMFVDGGAVWGLVRGVDCGCDGGLFLTGVRDHLLVCASGGILSSAVVLTRPDVVSP